MISESRTTSACRSSGSPSAPLPAPCRRPRLPSRMAACPPEHLSGCGRSVSRVGRSAGGSPRRLPEAAAAARPAHRIRRGTRRHSGLSIRDPEITHVCTAAGGFKRHIDIKDGSEFSLEGGQWPPDPRQPSGQRRDEQQLACMHLRGTQPVDELDPCHGVVDRQARQLGCGHL